uniref:Uncharacterized protein n=1 Tax=Myotis myotis TaxID=51298 RepID=A0A7J7T5V9_MYOMY|nr:hypothetical protein mMyoMyo1_009156 [Myotis myotis]
MSRIFSTSPSVLELRTQPSGVGLEPSCRMRGTPATSRAQSPDGGWRHTGDPEEHWASAQKPGQGGPEISSICPLTEEQEQTAMTCGSLPPPPPAPTWGWKEGAISPVGKGVWKSFYGRGDSRVSWA